MLLALDVGNTNVTVGAFNGARLRRLWRLATDVKKTADEYAVVLRSLVAGDRKGLRPSAVIYGSVVPALSPVLEAAVRSCFGLRAVAVTSRSPLGIRLRVDRPAEVGVDRMLNALAVRRLYGTPAVIVDFGTATTFDCVSEEGDYLGGAILLGPKVAALALAEHTAQLPEVEILKPARVIGTNTVECIQAGLYHGYLGMVERVLRETLAEMSAPQSRARAPRAASPAVQVMATGGLAGLFAEDLPRVDKVVPDLTLQGLRLAYETLAAKKGRGAS